MHPEIGQRSRLELFGRFDFDRQEGLLPRISVSFATTAATSRRDIEVQILIFEIAQRAEKRFLDLHQNLAVGSRRGGLITVGDQFNNPRLRERGAVSYPTLAFRRLSRPSKSWSRRSLN